MNFQPSTGWQRRFGFGVLRLARRSANAWYSHDAASRGASLSFYTLFALAPVLLIATWLGETILGKDSVNRSIVAQLQALIGDAGASAVNALLAGSMNFSNGIARSVVGFLSLLIGATSVFAELQRALDTVWGTQAAQGAGGIWQSMRTRILSFGLILGMGFLLLVSLIVSAGLGALGMWLGSVIVQWTRLLWIVNTSLGVGIATLLFAMIYKFLPNRTIAWGDVLVGALVTAGLFTIGKFLIGLYLSKSAFTSGYGVAGSLIVLLLWIYYSAQIFLFGAEFTHAFACEHGSQRGAAQRASHRSVLQEPTKAPDRKARRRHRN